MSERASGGVLRAWLALLLWAALILRLSGDDLAAASTWRLLGPLFRWLLPAAAPETRELLHFLSRKAAHVLEYAVLGGLAVWAFARTPRIRSRAAAPLALLLVTAVAGIDETRQGRSAARTGSVADVGLDACGGALAISAAALARRRRKRSGAHVAPPKPAGRETAGVRE